MADAINGYGNFRKSHGDSELKPNEVEEFLNILKENIPANSEDRVHKQEDSYNQYIFHKLPQVGNSFRDLNLPVHDMDFSSQWKYTAILHKLSIENQPSPNDISFTTSYCFQSENAQKAINKLSISLDEELEELYNREKKLESKQAIYQTTHTYSNIFSKKLSSFDQKLEDCRLGIETAKTLKKNLNAPETGGPVERLQNFQTEFNKKETRKIFMNAHEKEPTGFFEEIKSILRKIFAPSQSKHKFFNFVNKAINTFAEIRENEPENLPEEDTIPKPK